MQTFLPYPSIIDSVASLDNKRLGKQRVEAMQILKALADPGYGWQNHPAVKMWRGYEEMLKFYMNVCIDEWKRRGYKNTMVLVPLDVSNMKTPPWIGNDVFHSSHRSNLLRKDPDWYGKFGWKEPIDIPYHWPN